MDTLNQNTPLSIRDITINDNFWTPFMERIRTRVIPYQWDPLNDKIPGAEPSYCMRKGTFVEMSPTVFPK